jgi:hypothetical protein
LRQIGAIPPAAAQGPKKGRRIGRAIGRGLHEIDDGLLVGLFRVEEGEVIRLARFQLLPGQIEGDFGVVWERGSTWKREILSA